MQFLVLFVFGFFSLFAKAQTISALLASPQEKFNAGIYYSGAFAVNQVPQCNPQAVLRLVGPKLLTEESQIKFANNRLVSIGFYNKSLAFDINQILERLVKAGDKDITKRHICVGAYDYGYVVNAISYSVGFILYDPKLVLYMNEELVSRSMYSMRQVLYHELAHQFQYWYGSIYSQDSTERRGELVADCVGAALSGLELEGLSEDLYKISAEGVVQAVSTLGDFESKSKHHHGTPTERAKSAREGLAVVKNKSTYLNLAGELTAKSLLRRCEKFWQGQ